MVRFDTFQEKTFVRLLPNRSSSWAQTKWLIFIVSSVTMLIAVYWTLRGAWFVLPFAVLQILFVAFIFWLVCHITYHQQLLTVDRQQLIFAWGKTAPKKSWTFALDELVVRVEKARHSLSADKVILTDLEKKVAIGCFLNKDDTDKLVSGLKELNINIHISGHHHVVAIDGFNG